MLRQSIEGDLNLALNALKSNPQLTIRQAASIYNVPKSTLHRRRHGQHAKRDVRPPCQKLTSYEEESIVRYIIDLDSRSFPPRLSGVREMADQLLAERGALRVGTNWAANFVRRRPELRTRFNRRIDYKRVLCEDPDAYRAWFSLVRNVVAKYGIHDDDIYNFDETGFAMGKISAETVVTTSDRRGRPRAVQQGNQEWVTVIQGVGASGNSIPPYIIFAGKVHLDSWTSESPLPLNWVIDLTDNGWTTNEKGLAWVKHFDFHTKGRTKGAYRLLILDGHESHHSTDFELYCKEQNIVTLCMPAHSSHKLQPLDVGCFGPLKRAYGKEIEGLMRAHITYIAKEDFLPAFYKAYNATITLSNIQAGFRATGLVPYDPEYVISQLDVKPSTPTPPGSSTGLPQPWVSKTPNNPTEIESQSAFIERRIARHQDSSPSSIIESLRQLKKGTALIVHEHTLIRYEVVELRDANDRLSRRRRTKRKQIQKGESLTIEQAQALKDQIDATQQLEAETSQNSGRKKRIETRARRCGVCGEPGHNARTCQKVESASGEEDCE